MLAVAHPRGVYLFLPTYLSSQFLANSRKQRLPEAYLYDSRVFIFFITCCVHLLGSRHPRHFLFNPELGIPHL